MNLGAYDQAATLYESCLEGAYEDDPYIMMDFGRALFMSGSHEEAKETLLKIKKEHPNFIQKKETSLLLARAYEELNDTGRALSEYQSVAGIYPGEEPRCRYAMLLNKSGRREEAEKVFNEIIFGSRSNPRYYRREQRQWINLARQHLKLFQNQG
jgi:hypothetical protein